MTRHTLSIRCGIWAIALVSLIACQTPPAATSLHGKELGSESSKGGTFATLALDGARAWSFVGIAVPDPKNFTGRIRLAMSFSPGAGDDTVRVEIGDDAIVQGKYRRQPADAAGIVRYQLAFEGNTRGTQHVEAVTFSKDQTALITSVGRVPTVLPGSNLDELQYGPAALRLAGGENDAGNGLAGAAFERHFRRNGSTYKRVCRFQVSTVSCVEDGGLIFTGTYVFEASTRHLVVHLGHHADRTYTLVESDGDRRLLPLVGAAAVQEKAGSDKLSTGMSELCGDLEDVDPEDSDSETSAGLWLRTATGRFRVMTGKKAVLGEALSELAPNPVCVTPQKITVAPPPKASKVFVKSYRVP